MSFFGSQAGHWVVDDVDQFLSLIVSIVHEVVEAEFVQVLNQVHLVSFGKLVIVCLQGDLVLRRILLDVQIVLARIDVVWHRELVLIHVLNLLGLLFPEHSLRWLSFLFRLKTVVVV